MKKLLLGLLVLGSFSSFGVTLDSAMQDDNSELIKKAIVEVLKETTLSCEVTFSTSNGYSVSNNSWLIQYFNQSNTTVTVNENNNQPIIVASNYFRGGDGVRRQSIMEVTTTNDLKGILKIENSVSTIVLSQVNIGTLVAPKFVEKSVSVLKFSESCSL